MDVSIYGYSASYSLYILSTITMAKSHSVVKAMKVKWKPRNREKIKQRAKKIADEVFELSLTSAH